MQAIVFVIVAVLPLAIIKKNPINYVSRIVMEGSFYV